MKSVMILVALLAAGPALAHTGTHIHPHGDDPVWLPLLLGALSIGSAGVALAVVRRK